MLSAYDFGMARCADQAGVDIVFVSDAFATIGMGRASTKSATVDEVIYHTRAVKAGAGASLVVSSMPFLSYVSPDHALENARRIICEGGADAVEIEGAAIDAGVVRALVDNGVPVIAHAGLTKQVATRNGRYSTEGKTAERALEIAHDAIRFAEAGAFALVLECVPDLLARVITRTIPIPTIGFGAGPYCDGQGLISHDLLGLFELFLPKFAKRYTSLSQETIRAFKNFRTEVADGIFPEPQHCVPLNISVLTEMLNETEGRDALNLDDRNIRSNYDLQSALRDVLQTS